MPVYPDMKMETCRPKKAAHLAARQHGGELDHPLKGPVTLRWRS
jgi:hypothetical protein